ncbi:MAG: serine/threonine protein kinase [Sandaracinaceae bacterium]|nr:serine/threonine protein kinase [Sandaracinaceae bacterium]
MGAVYVAEQRSTGKLRALKVMHPELVPDVKSRLRFVEEARVGARIASEHIVDVVGAGVDEATGVPWLAMELLEGESLDAIVSREGGLAPEAVRELFLQMGHALGAAHDRGIVHRDLKPENVFVARAMRTGASLTVKILDFGIAKTIQESKAGVTSTSPIGTPLFMAPEQGTPGAQLRAATDVWALGLIAFHALTGRHYWLAASHGHGVQALFAEVFVHALVPASRRAAELGATAPLPPGFDAWFARCVVREPEARFPDARVAIDALLFLLSGGAPAARPSPYAATMPAAATQPLTSAAGTVALPTAQPMSTTDYGARRSSGVGFIAFGLAAAALIGVGAVAGAVVLLGSEDPAPPPVPHGARAGPAAGGAAARAHRAAAAARAAGGEPAGSASRSSRAGGACRARPAAGRPRRAERDRHAHREQHAVDAGVRRLAQPRHDARHAGGAARGDARRAPRERGRGHLVGPLRPHRPRAGHPARAAPRPRARRAHGAERAARRQPPPDAQPSRHRGGHERRERRGGRVRRGRLSRPGAGAGDVHRIDGPREQRGRARGRAARDRLVRRAGGTRRARPAVLAAVVQRELSVPPLIRSEPRVELDPGTGCSRPRVRSRAASQ